MAGPRPCSLYIVSDSQGFLGNFFSLQELEEKVVSKYSLAPLLIQEFPVACGPLDTVWVVLYQAQDAVAFASNSRAEALRVYTCLANVGLVYEDALEFWAQPANTVQALAVRRLELIQKAHGAFAGEAPPGAAQDKMDALFAREEAEARTRAQLQAEERISILKAVCVVDPRQPLPPPDPEAEAGDRRSALALPGIVAKLRAQEDAKAAAAAAERAAARMAAREGPGGAGCGAGGSGGAGCGAGEECGAGEGCGAVSEDALPGAEPAADPKGPGDVVPGGSMPKDAAPGGSMPKDAAPGDSESEE